MAAHGSAWRVSNTERFFALAERAPEPAPLFGMARSPSPLRPAVLAGLVALFGVGCSTSDPSEPASSPTLDADQEWVLHLNEDGDSDGIVLTGDEVRFLVRMADDYVAVRDKEGRELVVDVSERVTVTCSADGVSVQTFQPLRVDAEMGALRLSGLEVEGSTGAFIPSPSFFFGPEFELPTLGSGCPNSE